MRVDVALTLALAPAPDAARDVVVLDVLRATSSIVSALAAGATGVEPAGTVEAAITRARACGALLGGEREGLPPPGFDLGNSPREFTRERVNGKTLAFASTNGSLALLAGSRCRRRLLGSFAALSATVEALGREHEIWLVCAGKLGGFALEDAACAGAIAARLAARGASLGNDEARFAATLAPADAAEVRGLVAGSDHGRWLATLGEPFAADVADCATLDAVDSAEAW